MGARLLLLFYGVDKGPCFATIRKDMINIMTSMDKNVGSG